MGQLRNDGLLVGCRIDKVTSCRFFDNRFTGMLAAAHLSGPVRVCVHAIPNEVVQLLTDVRDALTRIEERADAAAPGVARTARDDPRRPGVPAGGRAAGAGVPDAAPDQSGPARQRSGGVPGVARPTSNAAGMRPG
jgi:hypothetical protein